MACGCERNSLTGHLPLLGVPLHIRSDFPAQGVAIGRVHGGECADLPGRERLAKLAKSGLYLGVLQALGHALFACLALIRDELERLAQIVEAFRPFDIEGHGQLNPAFVILDLAHRHRAGQVASKLVITVRPRHALTVWRVVPDAQPDRLREGALGFFSAALCSIATLRK